MAGCELCGAPGPFDTEHSKKVHRRQYCPKAQTKRATVIQPLQKRRAVLQEVEQERVKRARNGILPEPEHALPPIPDRELTPEPARPPTPDPPPTRQSGRPYRQTRLPGMYEDFVPSALIGHRRPPADLGMPEMYDAPSPSQSPSPEPPEIEAPPPPRELKYTNLPPNEFGLFRSFLEIPAVDPEAQVSLDSFCDNSLQAAAARGSEPVNPAVEPTRTESSGLTASFARAVKPWFAPFRNVSSYRVINWMLSGANTKSLGETDRLVKEVLLQEDFDPDELRGGWSAAREAARLDEAGDDDEWEDEAESHRFRPQDGWHEGSVRIKLPSESRHFKFASEAAAPDFEVKGIQYRRLIEIIKNTFQSATATSFNLIPYRMYWKPDHGSVIDGNDEPQPEVDIEPQEETAAERAYSEVYNSEAMVTEYEHIMQSNPPEPQAPYTETVIAALMFWSDSTHLAQFGNASLWPIYMFFGNQTKYERCKPSSNAAHHVAYIPSLPDTFQDIYSQIFGFAATADTIRHCKRELMHAIWLLLLDDEFMAAYEHGIVLRFADGICRRVFPRIFTYSADYPEKVLLAAIRYLAKCPCPRCLVLKSDIAGLGTQADRQTRENAREDGPSKWYDIQRVRRWLYVLGLSFGVKRIKETLEAYSGTATRNAFSIRLAPFGFNSYNMFVPDLLHEFELGVWKAVFIHLLRILYAAGQDKIQELNRRYRLVPTFGRGTIRRFTNNTSAMKKLAARDWEDILLCSIPVFEGLLPEPFNAVVLELLFVLASWHAYAKLRIHTNTTLGFLDESTTTLGERLRNFKETVCAHYRTTELPTEEAARGRRQAALANRPPRANASRGGNGSTQTSGPRTKEFNMSTYKLHALGDYMTSAVLYGPSDNYSTQTGELEHRRVKRWYARTNKKEFTRQIARQQRRAQILERIRRRSAEHRERHGMLSQSSSSGTSHNVSLAEDEHLPPAPPDVHYRMAQGNRFPLNLTAFLSDNYGDPAVKDFLPKLKDHFLARFLGMQYEGDERTFTDEDRRRVIIKDNVIYKHQVLRVNYTSYDVRRMQDSINPRTHADVMLLGHDDEEDEVHPYWFARVLGLYHAFVYFQRPGSRRPVMQRMEFAWVRWFGKDGTMTSGWQARRLPRVGYVPVDVFGNGEAGPAFGFLDPKHIIRSVHLVPAFAHGTTDALLGPSIARRPQDPPDEDWQFFYVNMFVDRDMVMRFRGGGVGHLASLHRMGEEYRRDRQRAAIREDRLNATRRSFLRPVPRQDAANPPQPERPDDDGLDEGLEDDELDEDNALRDDLLNEGRPDIEDEELDYGYVEPDREEAQADGEDGPEDEEVLEDEGEIEGEEELEDDDDEGGSY
ncbi:hypothetical protein EIP91_003851 [Steccherinum ochraceum]|uniref:Uncharacterized protein n=1 Tax=Steccherinum ochraceum TaxID=92696 RepID=A0A4V2MW22_9APHY|nr:hypothetical protein EIP91_003851 [Steccherinum ochraceum]